MADDPRQKSITEDPKEEPITKDPQWLLVRKKLFLAFL